MKARFALAATLAFALGGAVTAAYADTLVSTIDGGYDIDAYDTPLEMAQAAGLTDIAERLARAAPLKLWATLMLCIAPCTLLVLAFPVAQLLALLLD